MHHYSIGGGKKILQSCEINFSLHSHIWFYFYSCTRDLKEKALKVNSRFLKCLTVHVPVLFSTSWKIQPIFISAAYPCLSFVLQQHCMFLKIDLDEFHPSFTKTQKRQMVLTNKIYHWGLVNLLKKNFFFLSSHFKIYFNTYSDNSTPSLPSSCICQDLW